MQIGHIPLANRLFVAPMAGVTDRLSRRLRKALGAAYAVSEMGRRIDTLRDCGAQWQAVAEHLAAPGQRMGRLPAASAAVAAMAAGRPEGLAA